MAMYEIRRVFINILRTKTILSILIAVICIRKLCHDITYILVFICFCLVFFLPELVTGNNNSFLLFESVADLRKREVNVIDILTSLL